MKRVLASGVAAALIALLLAAAGANADGRLHEFRWDIVDLSFGATAGGQSVSTDPATGDTVTLSGSGQFETEEREADGGGTFVHRSASGEVLGEGIYRVTALRSWKPLSGSLVGTGLVDGIGDLREARSGIAKLGLTAYVDGAVVAHGVITIYCALPGAPAGSIEGVALHVRTADGATADFTEVEPDNGPTVFHVLQ
ncbi:MAG: hypothetical protein ABR529_14685 [Actinomycetota bacterium]